MSVWTDDMVAMLTEMWPTHTATVIGARLKVTRNAVIGKATRLELPPKTRAKVDRQKLARSSISAQTHRSGAKNTGNGGGLAIKLKRKGKRVWNDIRNVRPPMQIVAPPAPVEPLNLTLMQLGSGQCRFIAGEPGSGYCGHPVEARSLCAFHYRLCWRRLDPELSRRHRRSAEYMARVGG